MYTAESCTFLFGLLLCALCISTLRRAAGASYAEWAGGFYTVSEGAHGLLLCHLKKQDPINSSSDITGSSVSVRCVRQSASETAIEGLYCTKGVGKKL